MLGNNYYFHHTTKKIVIAFGKTFDQIYVQRRSNDGAPNNTGTPYNQILVPVLYGNKEKWLVRRYQNPDLEKQNVSVVLPRIGFEISGMSYDTNRKLPTVGRNVNITSSTSANVQTNPVPYNISIQLSILTDSADDATQIFEQIVPFFQPEYTLAIQEIPDMNIAHDIPIVLANVSTTDNYESDFLNKRIIVWTLDFVVKAYFYPPVKIQNVIKKTQNDIHIVALTDGEITDHDVDTTPRNVRVREDINPVTAGPDDDFGFSKSVEIFYDNKKYNPYHRRDEEIV